MVPWAPEVNSDLMWWFDTVTRPFFENRLHWIPDPAPPAPRRLDDLASPTSDPAIPMPPLEAYPRLPRRLRPRRRRKRRTPATARENSAPCSTGLATPAYAVSQ